MFRSSIARSRIVCRSAPCPVFSLSDPAKVVTIEDIDGLLILTNRMSEKNKRDVFNSHNVNYDNVREYYDAVVFMEKMYDKSPSIPEPIDFAKYYDYLRRIVTVLLLIVSGRF